MAIKQKSPERLKAQVAAFAAERVSIPEDRRHIIKNAGEIALGKVADVRWVRRGSRLSNNEVIPVFDRRIAATAEEYKEFLKNRTTHEHKLIKEKTAMYEAYADFAPIVDPLKESLPFDRFEHQNIPGFLGDGAFSSAFAVEKDGKHYAVRIPAEDGANAVDYHMNRAILGKKLPHFEQIIAVSPETGATVAEMMSGKQFDSLLPEDLRKVTDEQLEELIDTLETAVEHDIAIDANGSNIFYDPDEGFGFIDYHPQVLQGRHVHKMSRGYMLGLVADVIANPGDHAVYPSYEVSEEQYANLLDLEKAQLDILERLRTIAPKKLESEDLTVALNGRREINGIDKEIQKLKEKIREHSDPEKVDALIKDAKKLYAKLDEKEVEKPPLDGWGKA